MNIVRGAARRGAKGAIALPSETFSVTLTYKQILMLQRQSTNNASRGRLRPLGGTRVSFFDRKKHAEISVFLVKILKIRGGRGQSPQTPGCAPPPLPNPGCATGPAYEVLPPLEILGSQLRIVTRSVSAEIMIPDKNHFTFCCCCRLGTFKK